MTFALAGLVRGMKRWVETAAEMEKQSMALETVAGNFGFSSKKVGEAINKLAEDGIFSIGAISQAFKNLLSMGIDIDLATKAIDTFKDSILANGRATISMDEALTTGTQGLKEFRSQVSDNLGVMDNLDQILKRYPDLIKKYGQATALVIGFTKEAARFEGARAKILDKLSGKMLTLSQKVTMLKKALGEALSPTAHAMVDTLMKYFSDIRTNVEKNQEILHQYAKNLGNIFKDTVKFIGSMLKPISEVTIGAAAALKGIADFIAKLFMPGLKKAEGGIWAVTKKIAILGINLKLLRTIMQKINKEWKVNMLFDKNITIGIITQIGNVLNAFKKLWLSIKTGTTSSKKYVTVWSGQIIGAFRSVGAAAVAAGTAIKGFIFSILPFAAIMGLFYLVEHLLSKLAENVKHKKELVALDEKRKVLAADILEDTERLGETLENIKIAKGIQPLMNDLEKLKETLESMEETEVKISGRFTPQTWDALSLSVKVTSDTYKKQQEDIKLAEQRIKEFVEKNKEAFDYLEKYGIKFDKTYKNFTITLSDGTKILDQNIEQAEEWLNALKQMEEGLTGVMKLSEEAMKISGESEELWTEAIRTRNELSNVEMQSKILGFFDNYIEKTEDAQRISNEFNDRIKNLKDQISLAEKNVALLSDRFGENNVKVIEQKDALYRLNKELIETQAGFKNVDRISKEWAKTLEVQISTALQGFMDTLTEAGLGMDDELTVIEERIAGTREEIEAAIMMRTGETKITLFSQMAKEAKTINTEIARSRKTFDAQMRDYTRQWEGINNALEDITIKEAEKARHEDIIATTEKEIEALKERLAIKKEELLAGKPDIFKTTSQEEYLQALKKEEDINKQIIELENEIAAKIDEKNETLRASNEIVNKIGISEEERQKHAQEMIDIEKLISDLKDDQLTKEEKLNSLIEWRKNLLREMQLTELELKFKGIVQKRELAEETSIYKILGIPTPMKFTKEFQDLKKHYNDMWEQRDELFNLSTDEGVAQFAKLAEDFKNLLNAESDFWFNYGEIIHYSVTQVTTTLTNFYAQRRQMESQNRMQREIELAVIDEQEKRGIQLEMSYEEARQQIRDRYHNEKKIAHKQEELELWRNIQAKIEMLTYEMITTAAIQKLMGTGKNEVDSAMRAANIRIGAAITVANIEIAAEQAKSKIKGVASTQSTTNAITEANAIITAANAKMNASQVSLINAGKEAAIASGSGGPGSLGGLGGIGAFLGGPGGLIVGGLLMAGTYLYAKSQQKKLEDELIDLQAENQMLSDYGVNAPISGPNQASTYGSTIQGQPMNVTINPSIYIEGELIGIGADGVQELRDGLIPLITSAVNDAIGEGNIQLEGVA